VRAIKRSGSFYCVAKRSVTSR